MPGFVILPGLDGWAEARRELVDALAPAGPGVVADYPVDRAHSTDELDAVVRRAVAEADAPTILVAESYSGPAAIRIAADPPAGLAALVLVSTFARAPAPSWARHAISGGLMSVPPPGSFIRHLLVGPDAPAELVDLARRAIARVEPRVLATRLKQALATDVRRELARSVLPILHVEPTRDRLVGPRHAIARPGAEVERVRLEGPHAILQRHPAAAAAVIADFAARVARDAR